MKFLLGVSKTFLFAIAVFFVTLAVYLFTLAPIITMEDSGELVAAAATLGIAHPSGYPLYVILGKLFTLIPVGTVAWRVNLMSAVFGALTVSLLQLLLERVTRRSFLSASLALLLAFSPTFWSQSVIAEVYTLNTFFVVLLALIAWHWQESRRDYLLYLFAGLFGLGLTNHTMLVLLAPAFMAFFILTDRGLLKRWRLIIVTLFCFLVGLSLYLYIPLRAFQAPLFNWGPIRSWRDALIHIGRLQYSDVSFLANQFSKTGLVIEFFLDIYEQFYLPTLVLALAGLIYLWKTKRNFAILTLLIFLGNSFGIIYLRKFGWGHGIEYTYHVYYLPAFLMVIAWLAASCSYALDFLARLWREHSPVLWRLSVVALYLVIISLPISFLVGNYQRSDLSGFWLNYDYTKNLLASLPQDAFYFFAYDGSVYGDTEIFSLVYLQLIENDRPDVTIISDLNFFNQRYNMTLPADYFKLDFNERRQKILGLLNEVPNRPIFTNFAVTKKSSDGQWWSVSNGYAYRVMSATTTPFITEALYNSSIRGIDDVSVDSIYPVAGLAAHHYYSLAAYYLTAGQPLWSQRYLITAFQLDRAPLHHEYRRFLDYRAEWRR